MLEVATIVLWVFGIGCLLVVLALVALRLSFAWSERRKAVRSADLRHLYFTYLMGDEHEALETERQLVTLRGREWQHAKEQAFTMLPKLRGDSRSQLVELLRTKGAVHEALRQTRSWSAVRRCRGAYGLGQIGGPEHAATVRDLLRDRKFLVRRVAVRALGTLGDADGVVDLLELAREEPRLSRDLIASFHKIGPDAVPALREEIRVAIAEPGCIKSGALAATTLGLLGDYPSRHLLSGAATCQHPSLAAAAAEALGALSSPDTEPVLIECLADPSLKVRAAAARALASMGSEMSVPHLIAAVDREEPSFSREAAGALVKLGSPDERHWLLSRQRRRWHRGLTEVFARHWTMMFRPRYGVIGMVTMPWFLLFELLAPFVELFGVLYLAVVLILLGLEHSGVPIDYVDVPILILLLATSVVYAIFMSLMALLGEEISFRRYSGGRNLALAIWAAVEENFGYRQLTAVWRAQGTIDALRGRRHVWGDMKRQGFGEPTS